MKSHIGKWLALVGWWRWFHDDGEEDGGYKHYLSFQCRFSCPIYINLDQRVSVFDLEVVDKPGIAEKA